MYLVPGRETNLCLPFNRTGLVNFSVVFVRMHCKGIPLDMCGWGDTLKLRKGKYFFRSNTASTSGDLKCQERQALGLGDTERWKPIDQWFSTCGA